MGALDNAAVLAAEGGEGGSYWERAYPVIPHPGELPATGGNAGPIEMRQ